MVAMATRKATKAKQEKKTTTARTILQIDTASQKVIGEHATPQAAADAVGKAYGGANILLCCGNNHIVDGNARTAYGYCWRFSD